MTTPYLYYQIYKQANKMKKLVAVIIALCSWLSVSGQDIDSLYLEFKHSEGQRFIELANEIMAAGGGPAFTDEAPRDEVIAMVARMMIMYDYDLQRFESVVRRATEASEIYRSMGDTLNLAGCIYTLAIAHQRLGNNDKAIDNYYESADLLEAIGADASKRRYRYALNSIAGIYLAIGNLEMAEQLFDRCLAMINDMESERDNMIDRATYLSNLSKVYGFQAALLTGREREEKLAEAVRSAESAYELSERYDDEAEKLVERLTSLAQACIASGRYTRAEETIGRAYAMAEENSLTYWQCVILQNYAYLASESGNRPLADNYYSRAIRIAEDNGYNELLQQIMEKAYLNERTANPARALDYYERFVALRDSVVNQETLLRIDEFQVQYDVQGKELEIVRQQAEIGRHESRQLMFIGGLAAAVLLLALLGYVIVLRNRRNRALAEANETKDKFFGIISHDLKNPAIAQRDALQMLVNHSGEWDAASLATYYRELLKSADGQVELLYNLLNWAQVQTGRMPYHPVPFDLAAALRPDIDLVRSMAGRKGVAFEAVMPESVLITGDSSMIATVVRNLLTNAVKFTAAGGTVSLNIELSSDGGYSVAVRDTGVGMSWEQIAGLFRIDSRRATMGTAGEQGSGLGLIVCRELLEKHGTHLDIESEEGKGSEFRFTLHERDN